ncbi:MAG: hypothetical protein Q9202_002447 [Teloschistes flavicans]
MLISLQDRLLRRELGRQPGHTAVKGLYGDRSWVENLDIVNELGGHSGCVNALSWSSSGRLLASGSDDQHLNIHSYQPDSSTSQFALNTTVSTGHTANIFSVKFMPHSNDKTVVTCAGDFDVRVFDIENSGRSTIPAGPASSMTAGNQLNNVYKGVQYLSHGDTNTRIYRSHADRVKRIVTESSPFLFLTCSEDGEVRQFDLRLPSSAYPRPKGGRGSFARRAQYDDANVPPPLISYKRHHLDLNTISCSATQPHYIALGGAHLHCFLHDRRMLGRDRLAERGTPGSITPTGRMSPVENEYMGAATKCVRRFAPNGKSRMRRTDNGHITACKISDANPNELIASWSGDQIYSFDILKSPDAVSQEAAAEEPLPRGKSSKKVRDSSDRKRKRRQGQNSTSSERDLALRVRYENGQSEDIAMDDSVMTVPGAMAEESREAVLNDSQRRGLRIAKSVVKIRKLLFSLGDSSSASNGTTSQDPSSHRPTFTSVFVSAASVLPQMDEISRSWRYPVDPREEDIVFQQSLRGHRDSSRRFVQAAGALAKTLGGRPPTNSSASTLGTLLFQEIEPAPLEGPSSSQHEIFSLDFLRAILLWLDDGPLHLLRHFKKPSFQRNDYTRFPIPEEVDHLGGIDEYLIPYLLRMASSRSIPNVDASRFERDELRQVFQSETSAVIAFSSAIRMPLKDLSRAIMPAGEDQTARERPVAQDKKAAIKFWAFKVGRGILMNAGESINYQYVDIAFGGLGTSRVDQGRIQEDIDPDEMEDVVDTISLVQRNATENADESPQPRSAGPTANRAEPASVRQTARGSREASIDFEDAGSDADVVLVDDLHDEIEERIAAHDEQEGGSDNDGDADEDESEDDGDEDEDDAGDSDQEITDEERQFVFQLASDRGKSRESVEADVSYSTHTRAYSGHCNIKTVKDCNFFGLNDEYVVSGSDSGHLFIWDKKTSELVNILQGDGEVVNVVQGHPYEPVLAVSGIDSTIKIFSPDNRAQDDAREGINVGYSSNGFTTHSSLSGVRRRARRAPRDDDDGAPEEGLASRKRMDQREEIVRENELQSRGGMREAFITVRHDGPYHRLQRVEVGFAEWLSWF